MKVTVLRLFLATINCLYLEGRRGFSRDFSWSYLGRG